MTRGLLVLAMGPRQYLRQAVGLLTSVRRWSPGERVAVVTDDVPAARRYGFDDVVPLDPTSGPPFAQKLHASHYSPYDETLFVDADSLAYRPLNAIWAAMSSGADVTVQARLITQPFWCVDVTRLPTEYRLERYLEFNGGLLYWRRGTAADETFAEARKLFARYDELGLRRFGTQAGDEPPMSLALARRYGEDAARSATDGMWTPAGLVGPLRLDVLQGVAEFGKYHVVVHPALVHFAGPGGEMTIYRRELIALTLTRRGFPAPVARTVARSVAFSHRLARRLARRAPWDELSPYRRR